MMQGTRPVIRQLGSGTPLALERWVGAESLAVHVQFERGPVAESPSQLGLAHLLEHMLFRRTRRFREVMSTLDTIEAVGGVLNGETSIEYVAVWGEVPKAHAALLLDVIEDLLLHPVINDEEVIPEREVVISEISQDEDRTEVQAALAMDSMLQPGTRATAPVGGWPRTVEPLLTPDLLRFRRQNWGRNAMVVSVAGDPACLNEAADRLDEVVAQFPTVPALAQPPGFRQADQRQATVFSAEGVSQLAMGFALPSLTSWTDFGALRLLQALTTRRLRPLRRQTHASYGQSVEVTLSTPAAEQGGIRSTFVAEVDAHPQKQKPVREGLHAIMQQLGRGVSEDEVAWVQQRLAGELALRPITMRSRARELAAQWVRLRDVRSVEEARRGVGQLTAEDVNQLLEACDLPHSLACVDVVPHD